MKKTACPKCGSAHVESLGTKYPMYPSGCLLGGLLLASSHQGQLPHRFVCRDCDHPFQKRTRLALFNLVAMWIVIVFMILGIIQIIAALIYD